MPRPRDLSAASLLLALLAGCGAVTAEGDPPASNNQPPVAAPAQLATYMSSPLEGQLAGEDPDGDPLVFAVAAAPAGGALELADDGWFRYLPEPGRSGADAFSFVVDDGIASSAAATVDIAIATLTDGTPDTGFGDGGAVHTDFGEIDALSGVAALGDGRVVAVGNTGSSFALVAGYTAQGALDTTFGEAGDGTTRLNPGGYDGFGDVVQQASGRLVSVGQTQDGDRDFLLLGLDDTGHLDSSFGGGGITVTDVAPGQADVANAVALLPDDRLLVAGYASGGGDDDFAVARYSADGALDESFGTGGFTVIDFGGADRANDVAIDSAGNIVLVGEAAGVDLGIVRLAPDGERDMSFGDQGQVRVDFEEYDDGVAVAFGPDGALYVGGNSASGDQVHMMVVKFTPAGERDMTFGDEGRALAASGTATTYAMDMLLLPNQTLLLVGGWSDGAVTEAAAARLDLAGRLDPGFGAGGFYHQAIGSDGDDTLFAAALQADGKVVAAGWSRNQDLDGLLVRLGW